MIYLYYNTGDKIHASGVGHNILNINYYYDMSLKLNAKFILLNIAYIHNKYLLSTESEIFLKHLKIKDKNIITNKNIINANLRLLVLLQHYIFFDLTRLVMCYYY